MKNKWYEIVSYGIAGVLTTIVNYIVYFGLNPVCKSILLRNTLAWIVAVAFAYVVNRKYVFHSQNETKKEGVQFFILRLLTLCVENALLVLFVQEIGVNEMISKISISVVTVIGNYVLCKFKIFRKEGEIYG